jgi:hypothetical protein
VLTAERGCPAVTTAVEPGWVATEMETPATPTIGAGTTADEAEPEPGTGDGGAGTADGDDATDTTTQE